MDIPIEILYVTSTNPVIIFKWAGKNDKLPSVLLNSHMDVVPTFPDQWEYPPFDAFKKTNGDIIARGSQDMKCVGMSYLEAIFELKKEGKVPLRDVYIVFVPDEEVGSSQGMALFVKNDLFKNMNVGYALDEGLPNPNDVYMVYNGERSLWWLTITAEGNSGHGSQFIENTVV
jgi:aminoacylase